jgi:hypothetical protein
LLSAGCGLKGGLEAASRLQTRIQGEYGVHAAVNVNTFNGATTVSVQLDGLPPGDPKVVKAKIEALAKSEFPSAGAVIVMAQL